jgi:hypothetical protein
MLFNFYPFIFLFLPAVLLGYFATGRYGNWGPVIWLVLASVAFYAFGNWQFVSLLLASIASNYLIGLLLIAKKTALQAAIGRARNRHRRRSVDARYLQVCRLLRRQFQCPVPVRSDGEHSAAGRHLVLHVYPGRVPGRRLSRQGRALRGCRLMRCSSATFRI